MHIKEDLLFLFAIEQSLKKTSYIERRYAIRQVSHILRFSFARGLFFHIAPTFGQVSINGQSLQFSKPLVIAHLRISHKEQRRQFLSRSSGIPRSWCAQVEWGIIHFDPEFDSLLPQCMVIILRSNLGITLLAVQPANGNQTLLLLSPSIRWNHSNDRQNGHTR